MVKLKVVFVMGIVVSILIMCAFAPGICIERFVLPDGCCSGCTDQSFSGCNLCIVEEGKSHACR